MGPVSLGVAAFFAPVSFGFATRLNKVVWAKPTLFALEGAKLRGILHVYTCLLVFGVLLTLYTTFTTSPAGQSLAFPPVVGPRTPGGL